MSNFTFIVLHLDIHCLNYSKYVHFYNMTRREDLFSLEMFSEKNVKNSIENQICPDFSPFSRFIPDIPRLIQNP